MDRETQEQFLVITTNQKVIQRDIKDFSDKLDQVVAILRGIEDELRRRRSS